MRCVAGKAKAKAVGQECPTHTLGVLRTED